MHVDDRLRDAIFGETIEAMIDQRFARHLDQRLRQGLRQRPHARAEAGGEHHRGLRHGGHGGQGSFSRRGAERARQMGREPLPQRFERGMGEVLGERPLDARQQPQILRLAVAAVEPREKAENLGRALRAHDRIGGGEGAGIEGGIGNGAPAGIEREQPQFEIAGDFAARVLQQRGDVIGGRAEHGVLEIDEAEPFQPVALGEPMQVGRVKVAKRPGRRLREDRRQDLAPEREELHARARRRIAASDHGRVPVEREFDLDQHRLDVVDRQRVRLVLDGQFATAARARASRRAAPSPRCSARRSGRWRPRSSRRRNPRSARDRRRMSRARMRGVE